METTFITIHDLSPDARIIYCSDSVIDILGYSADEVITRSSWDYFHPDELPIARAKHGRGVEMDKAAVLSYCRMRAKDGAWVGCEVAFTVVYDVLVGCTSIYRRGIKSQNRALDAPIVRRLFSSSPRDPRYHMLSHLSAKFNLSRQLDAREPRAAMFLNRYTRTMTIMYATNGLQDLLGITGDELKGTSFYYCIQQDCLREAVACLENAKANDSIAYLRFWWRDPRSETHANRHEDSMDVDGVPTNRSSPSSSDEALAANFSSRSARATAARNVGDGHESSMDTNSFLMDENTTLAGRRSSIQAADSRMSSGEESNNNATDGMFSDSTTNRYSSMSSTSTPQNGPTPLSHADSSSHNSRLRLELEAVVSCTSDGLVVCLRGARPVLPASLHQPSPQQPVQDNTGFFVVPWAAKPSVHIAPPLQARQESATRPVAVPASYAATTSSSNEFMKSIRDIAVFAWALTGINGSLADYSNGRPRGEAQPASGLPIWSPDGAPDRVMVDGVGQKEDKVNNSTRNIHGLNGVVPVPADMTAQLSSMQNVAHKPSATTTTSGKTDLDSHMPDGN